MPKTLFCQEYQMFLKIEFFKSELIELALLLGLNHPTTISLSQKLDILILDYQILSKPKFNGLNKYIKDEFYLNT